MKGLKFLDHDYYFFQAELCKIYFACCPIPWSLFADYFMPKSVFNLSLSCLVSCQFQEIDR